MRENISRRQFWFNLDSNPNVRAEGKQCVVGQKIPPPQPGPLGGLLSKRTHTWRDGIFCSLFFGPLSLFTEQFSRTNPEEHNFDHKIWTSPNPKKAKAQSCLIRFFIHMYFTSIGTSTFKVPPFWIH